MIIRRTLTNAFLKAVLTMLCRIDDSGLKDVPLEGPVIICINHINFLDAPLMQIVLHPRSVRGFAKKETWDTPFLKFLFNTFDAIPVDREKVDLKAFREVVKTMEEKRFLCMAPEGTRSGTGVLQKGRPGIVTLALKTGAPVLPLAHAGTEKFWSNFKRLRRTPITLRAGRPIYLESPGKADSKKREEMTDLIMHELAALLPPEMRGPYTKG
ncbi:lysophospholipid acyltransferase family protein [Spirochaeta isovalerica]|uniref:1-acyl-sn-glycerol-3-phosphate acyltransferase n=1 Tax=Spirochaeta isovalerica TaxID=150 RepID=A0A841RD09_9SPIO|nr:lysophospholipid acyltransferase family protein [Spirochaeta isovalerica]MBB6481843.1 1-acyl-sn-glycerol-3-phosphate acyltransferase [Spirochaeta isovalerica]